MKPVFYVLILITLIAGTLILDNYWKKETAFMKKLAAHHLNTDQWEKRVWLNRLQELTKKSDSNNKEIYQKDIQYLKKIDSTISNEQFNNIVYDSLSKPYSTNYPENLWDLPSDVRAIYLNDFILNSLDSMLHEIADLTFYYYTSPLQNSFELVITEVKLGDDSLKFTTDYFEVIDRDTPYINPVTGEIMDKEQFEIYESRLQQY